MCLPYTASHAVGCVTCWCYLNETSPSHISLSVSLSVHSIIDNPFVCHYMPFLIIIMSTYCLLHPVTGVCTFWRAEMDTNLNSTGGKFRVIIKVCLWQLLWIFVYLFNLHHFLPALDWLDVPEREGSGYRVTRAMPFSFSKGPTGSFTCPVCSTDTWDLGLKSHPNDMVWRGKNSRLMV